jgi:hypothetical protein
VSTSSQIIFFMTGLVMVVILAAILAIAKNYLCKTSHQGTEYIHLQQV